LQFCFGDQLIDLDRRELRRGSGLVALDAHDLVMRVGALAPVTLRSKLCKELTDPSKGRWTEIHDLLDNWSRRALPEGAGEAGT